MRFLIVALLLLSGCEDKASSGGVTIHRGDPARRAPKRKEKAGRIVQLFDDLGIVITCPGGNCVAMEDKMQSLYASYNEFQNRRGRITSISLADSDVVFNAKNHSLILPIQLTDKIVADVFVLQKGVESYQGQINGIKLSFPRDAFQINVIQKVFYVVHDKQKSIRSLVGKIDWIHFDGSSPGCTNRTWSISRDDFENHFDEKFNALKCN